MNFRKINKTIAPKIIETISNMMLPQTVAAKYIIPEYAKMVGYKKRVKKK